jgi:hypothetical protein
MSLSPLQIFTFLVRVAYSSEVYLFEVEARNLSAARRHVLNIPHLVEWQQLPSQGTAGIKESA